MNQNPPHIVMLNKAYPPVIGGIERHVSDLAEHLAQRGWRVSALVCNQGNFFSEERRRGVTVIRVPVYGRLFSLPFPRGYVRALKQLRPDLLHAHVPFPIAWRAVHKIAKDIPVVCTWHSAIIRQRALRPVYHRIEQKFLQRCARIFPTSQALLQSSKALDNHHQRCRIIPLALPQDDSLSPAWLNEQARQFRESFDKPVVLFVGRLVKYKGLKYLVQAMKDINAFLLVVGEGPLRESLQNQAQRLGIQDKIEWLGWVNEAEKQVLYHAADVFVLPSISHNEAFGYVLLEAMQAGCPAISTDLPTGVKIVNQHGETGLVVPPKNAEYLAAAMQKILGDQAVRSAYGRAARRRVETDYRFENILDQLEAEYRGLLSREPINKLM